MNRDELACPDCSGSGIKQGESKRCTNCGGTGCAPQCRHQSSRLTHDDYTRIDIALTSLVTDLGDMPVEWDTDGVEYFNVLLVTALASLGCIAADMRDVEIDQISQIVDAFTMVHAS